MQELCRLLFYRKLCIRVKVKTRKNGSWGKLPKGIFMVEQSKKRHAHTFYGGGVHALLTMRHEHCTD